MVGLSLADFEELTLAATLRIIEANRRHTDNQMVAIYRAFRWQTAVLANATGNLKRPVKDPRELMELPGDREKTKQMSGRDMMAELMKAMALTKKKQ